MRLTSVGNKEKIVLSVAAVNRDRTVRVWVDRHMVYRLDQNPVLRKQFESMIKKVMNHPGPALLPEEMEK